MNKLDEWCKNCIRGECLQTVEECKRTPEVTLEQIYDAFVKYGRIHKKDD